MDKSISHDYLNCGICLQIATDAIETSCCHNIYCESCIEPVKSSKKTCPACRKPNFETPICHLARRLINTLPIACPYDCGATLTRGDLNEHTKKCQKRIYKCARRGCDFQGASEEYSAHIIKVHYEDLIDAFEGLELKKRFSKSGVISGYYKQGGEHPINGTYRLEKGKLTMSTDDDVGTAKWEGSIDLETLNVRIVKQYNGAHSVEYRGKINSEVTVIEGQWKIGGYSGDDFKLILN